MMKKILGKLLAGTLTCGLLVSSLSVGTPEKTAKAAEQLNLNGTYHAAMGIQTADTEWMRRLAYFDDAENPAYGTDKADKLATDDKAYDGTFTDATIAGNGTYTVSLDGADFAGENTISQLFIATDIPNNTKIKFSDVVVTVNDKQVISFDEGFMEDEARYLTGGMVVLAINHWRPALETALKKQGVTIEGNGCPLVKGTGNEKISISFKVDGFNYNQGEEAPAEPDYVAPPVTAPAKGSVKKISGVTYKVTKSSKKNGTVTVSKCDKSQTKCTIPATVTIKGFTFKVTGIANSAFANNKKIKTVVVGKNVTSIGKKAFSGCSALKTIDLKKNTSLKTVGKDAVKDVNAKCVVQAPKAKVKAYKTLFKTVTVK